MSIREEVRRLVERSPGWSATQIAEALDEKTSTVSSILYIYVQTGVLRRKLGGGPNGGYTYFLAREPKRSSRFERILKD